MKSVTTLITGKLEDKKPKRKSVVLEPNDILEKGQKKVLRA